MAKKSSKKKSKNLQLEESKGKTNRLSFSSILIPVIILAITFGCFTTAIDNGFVNWDDDKNFYENEMITNLNSENFWSQTKAIFTTDIIGGYNPLTIFTFALDKQIYGLDNPMPWHLENVILHLACTFILFFIGRRLGLSLIGAGLLTLLFGIHPMRVESVAWVTERKDVLFGFFYLLSLFYYIKSKQEEKKGFLVLVWLFFILSLLSKIQAVILPISMVLVDYYLDGKLNLKKILFKTPFFIASLIFGIVSIKILQDSGVLSSTTEYGGIQRIFIGSWQYTVYLVKSIVPYRLSPLYPYPSSMEWYFYPSILSFLATAIFMIYAYIKKWKVLFFGIGFFLANVFFLLQIMGAGQGFLADRFTYIPYIGLFYIYAYYFDYAIERFPKSKNILLALVAVVVGIYGFMTFTQNKIWKDSGTLWTHVLKYYQRSTLPYGNRANFYRDNGQTELALKDYSKRISLKADDARVFNSRARLYFNFTDPDSLQKSISDYSKAIELNPIDVEYWANRGAAYAKIGDFENAVKNMDQSIKLDPNYANAYLNRSVIRNNLGQYQGALDDIIMFSKFKPYEYQMQYEIGRLSVVVGKPVEALKALQIAISKYPNKGIYYIEKAKAEAMLGNKTQAIADITKAKQLGSKVDYSVEQKIRNM